MPQVNTLKRRVSKPDAPTTRRGELRREGLLKAAREVFLEKGYAAASVEDVVSRVGGSKATLYSYFGNKEGLFDDMIGGLCDELRSQLAIPREVEGDLELTLTRFGKRMLKNFLDPDRVAMHRAIFAEAYKFPQLAQRIYESGPQRGAQEFSLFLRRQHEAGVLHCPDPENAAICFSEMIKASPQRRAMLGLPVFKNDREMEKFVGTAVRIFLNGCLPVKK